MFKSRHSKIQKGVTFGRQLDEQEQSFSHLVPQKIEPYIDPPYYSFGEQTDKGKKSKQLFCVATTACFYVCKSVIVGSSVKISHRYPWIAITSVTIAPESDRIILNFSTGTADFRFKDCLSFGAAIVSHLKSVLPNYHEVKYQIPDTLKIKEVAASKNQIVDLFISQSYLVDRAIDTDFIQMIKKMIKKDKFFKIDRSKISENNVQVLTSALIYAAGVNEVEIGGKQFPELWQRVSQIINVNYGITDLVISEYKKSKKFETFVASLQNSKVHNLSFKDVPFDDTMAEQLISSLVHTPVTQLEFRRCCSKKASFCKTIGARMLNFDTNRLRKFAIVKDVISDKEIGTIVRIMAESSIEDMAIVEAQLNIQVFFQHMHVASKSMRVTSLDLTGNRCPSEFTGEYELPDTLCVLKLKRVQWEGKSLLSFLSRQDYPSLVEVDFSSAVLLDSQVSELMSKLPPSSYSKSFRVVHWDSNPLFKKLLTFFSNETNLQALTISHCTVPAHEKTKEVIQSLKEFLSRTNIQKLAVAETLRELKDGSLRELKDVLIKHATLTNLDISGNAIGDAGLSILGDILRNNKKIAKVSFDEANLSNADALISFFNLLDSLDYIPDISRPAKEMARLSDKNGKTKARELKDAWGKVSDKRGDADVARDEDSTGTDASSVLPQSDASLTTTEQYLEASWDVHIGVEYDGAVSEWEALRQQYSYAKITGVSSVQPAKTSHNLIDLEFV